MKVSVNKYKVRHIIVNRLWLGVTEVCDSTPLKGYTLVVIIFENHNLSLGKFSSLPNVLEEFGSWFGALVRGQYLGHCFKFWGPKSISGLLTVRISCFHHSWFPLFVSCSAVPFILYLGQYAIIGQYLVPVCLTICYSIYISKYI